MLQFSAQPQKCTIHSCFLNAHSAATFSCCFSDSCTPPPNSSNVNDLVTWFNNQWSSALDTIAPCMTRSFSSDNSCPWINKNICCLKREARRVEHSWKKSKLLVHLLHVNELLSILNQNITKARIAWFADPITDNKHNPRVPVEHYLPACKPCPSYCICLLPIRLWKLTVFLSWQNYHHLLQFQQCYYFLWLTSPLSYSSVWLLPYLSVKSHWHYIPYAPVFLSLRCDAPRIP